MRQTAQLVLASKPSAVEPDRAGQRVGSIDGEIDESNGFNCVLPLGGCTTRKVGVVKVRRNPKRKMYANLVVLLGPKRSDAEADDVVRLRSGKLKVIRYRRTRR